MRVIATTRTRRSTPPCHVEWIGAVRSEKSVTPIFATLAHARTRARVVVLFCYVIHLSLAQGVGEDLDKLLAQSDFVLLTCPLNDETTGLLNARRLRQMKPTSVLINVARGQVVDERALWEALTKGTISGAILDVWWGTHESGNPSAPDVQLPWHTLPNVVMTPHSSGWTEQGAEVSTV
eukprot:SAG31_NODE_3626_length_4055_cov_16.812184_1_plen_179_part_00